MKDMKDINNKNWLLQRKKTLVFNNRKCLIAIGCSTNQLGHLAVLLESNISKACNGQLKTLRGFYFRYVDSSYNVSLEDIGTLKLQDYDKATHFQSKDFSKCRTTPPKTSRLYDNIFSAHVTNLTLHFVQKVNEATTEQKEAVLSEFLRAVEQTANSYIKTCNKRL